MPQHELRDSLADEWLQKTFGEGMDDRPHVKQALLNAFKSGWKARKVAVDYSIDDKMKG